MIKVKIITPKKKVSPANTATALDTYLSETAAEFQKEMQEYPPPRPWRSRPPRSGPRAGGRRTGAYGRGWTRGARVTRYSVAVTNNVRYAAVVGGPHSTSPGQSQVMADRGWKSVEDVAEEVVLDNLPDFSEVIFAT